MLRPAEEVGRNGNYEQKRGLRLCETMGKKRERNNIDI